VRLKAVLFIPGSGFRLPSRLAQNYRPVFLLPIFSTKPASGKGRSKSIAPASRLQRRPDFSTCHFAVVTKQLQ